MGLSGLVVRNYELNFSGPGSLPGRVSKSLFFNSDIKNLLLKANGGETESLIFLFWSALVVGGWMVVAWSRNSCLGPAEIASFVFLILLEDGGRKVSPRFHLFVSDVNQGNEEAV